MLALMKISVIIGSFYYLYILYRKIRKEASMKIKLSFRKDRKYLLELSKYLGVSSKALARDELGYYILLGKEGHIYTDSIYWYVVAEGNALEKRLSFMEPMMNGLVFRLDRMPTEKEASIIRKLLKLRKKRELSDEQVDSLIERSNLHYKMGISSSRINISEEEAV